MKTLALCIGILAAASMLLAAGPPSWPAAGTPWVAVGEAKKSGIRYSYLPSTVRYLGGGWWHSVVQVTDKQSQETLVCSVRVNPGFGLFLEGNCDDGYQIVPGSGEVVAVGRGTHLWELIQVIGGGK